LITDVDDVSIRVFAGTCPYDVNTTITKIENPPENVLPRLLNGYDFAPSGIVFSRPVEITIPYVVTGAAGTPAAYWYNSRTGALGGNNKHRDHRGEFKSAALRFRTTHLTPFFADSRCHRWGVRGGGGGGAAHYLIPRTKAWPDIFHAFALFWSLSNAEIEYRLQAERTFIQGRRWRKMSVKGVL
jgi:hypothetical protein